jgi:anti-sigma-K factor RskA
MSIDERFENTACTKYEEILEDYLEGALEPVESRAAEAHWRDCAGCRAALDQASASVRLLRAAGPSAGPGPAFARTVMARIRAAEAEMANSSERASFWQPLVRFGWRFAATATVLLAVLVTYDAGWGRHIQRNRMNARVMRGSDIFAPDPANPPASRDEVLMMVADTNHGN